MRKDPRARAAYDAGLGGALMGARNPAKILPKRPEHEVAFRLLELGGRQQPSNLEEQQGEAQ